MSDATPTTPTTPPDDVRPLIDVELLQRFRQGLAISSREHELIALVLAEGRKTLKTAQKDIARLRRRETEREEYIAAAWRALGMTEDQADAEDLSLAGAITRAIGSRR